MSVNSPNNGRQLIIQLRDCHSCLIPAFHASPPKVLDQTSAEAVALCDALEKNLLHGIKMKEFNGVPFWGLLEKLEVLIPPCIPLRNTVGAVASISSLKNTVARARAWVRQILNDGHIDEAVMFIMAQSELLRSYYNPDAVLLSPEDGPTLIAVLRSIKALRFNFSIEGDPQLNATPRWLVQLIQQVLQQPSPTARPAVTTCNANHSPTHTAPASSSSGTGGMGLSMKFDSFLKSFETSLDSVLEKVDAAANMASKFIDEQLEQSAAATAAGRSTPTSSVGLFTSPSARGGRMVPFFGSTLKELLLDERRTSHAYLNPLLGVPNQAARMIAFVAARASTPDLFRRPVPAQQLQALRREIEEEREIPAGTDVAAVALLLMQWLNQLPEPLLGYEHYTAILACAELEDSEHRARNLALLVQEASWYAKPLLLRLISLLARCIQPEFAVQNNLNIIAVSVLSTPCLLRPFVAALHASPTSFFLETEARERMQMAATASGSTTVEFIIAHQGTVLMRLREEHAQREAALSAKCIRIKSLQESIPEGVDTMFLEYIDEQRQMTIRELWRELEAAETLCQQPVSCSSSTQSLVGLASLPAAEAAVESDSSSKSSSEKNSPKPQDIPISDVLAHERWVRCGFLPAELPLREFNAPYGSLALQGLAGFMKRYNKHGAAMLRDYYHTRLGRCSLPQVCLRLMHFVVDVLRLLPPAGNSWNGGAKTAGSAAESQERPGAGVTPIQVLARQPSWLLLNDDKCVQELFDLALLTFEEAWKANTGTNLPSPQPMHAVGASSSSAQTLASSFAKVYGTLNDVINKRRPRTVEQMWNCWLTARLEEQERQVSAARLQQHGVSPGSPISTGSSGDRKQQLAVSTSELSAAAVEAAATIVNVVTTITQPSPTPVENKSEPAAGTKTPSSLGEDSSGSDSENVWVSKATSAVSSAVFSTEEFSEDEWVESAAASAPASRVATTSTGIATVGIAAEKSTGAGPVKKRGSGVVTEVRGASAILSPEQIQQLEDALPTTYQCYDWDLVYRLSEDGANVTTLVNKAKVHSTCLLVIKDSGGTVFGALITEPLKMGEKEKYYGNGTTAVFTFSKENQGIKYFPWSFKNSYFLITSKDSIAVGGGGSFAIYLDGDLHRGSSGPCMTFSSPCLASQEEFSCISCELFAMSTSLLGL